VDGISVEVLLYGPLARYGGDPENAVCASRKIELPRASRLRDVLEIVGLPSEERGVTFINGHLSAMPGLQPDLDRLLVEGDRIAFFHLKSMWPFQYRHGAALDPALQGAMDKPFHARANTPKDSQHQ
jgi:hypothetical protein